MKRTFLASLLALVMVLSLTACGGSAKTEESASISAPSAPMMDSAVSAGGSYGADYMAYEENTKAEAPEMESPAETVVEDTETQAAERKVIITAYLELETTSFDEAVQGLTALTEEHGGYFENSSVANHKSGSRWADYTVRIPAKNYKTYMNQAGELCHETWREAREEEITEAYYDTAGRLETQKIKLERLQELLSKAEVMEDIITIESAISETEWQIDNLSGTLRHYDSKVEYATVNINLREVYKLSNVEDVPETFGERIGNSFARGLGDFADTMEDLAVGFAYSWMWWLLGVAAMVLVIRVVWGMKLRLPRLPRLLRRKKKDDNSEEN